MNNNLIQDYLDNRLTTEQRASFNAELSENPALAKEVEALQSLKSTTRQTALSEPTPNLQPALSHIARTQSTNWFTKAAPYAVAGFAVFAIGLAANRVVSDQKNPTIASAKVLPPEAKLQSKSSLVMHWDGSDPVQGAEKIRRSFYRPIPTISLNDLQGAKFTAAECGSCWINFKYEYKGADYNIYGRCETGNIDSGLKTKFGIQTFYIYSDAIGWYDKDMTYVCNGGTATGRQTVAQYASKRTSELR